MNLIKTFLLTFLLTAVLSCNNEDKNPAQNSGLSGKWKMIEILADPGDGSGTFRPVKDEASSTLEFKANGDFKETKGIIHSSVNPYNTYKMLDDNRLELSIKNDTKTPPIIWYVAELTPTTLEISYGCIEPCRAKFIAIR